MRSFDTVRHTILPVHEYKICFVLHQKSANTSIKRMIKNAQGETELSKQLLNHSWEFLFPCEVPEDYYTVSVVRNPIERLKSLYADKFINGNRVGGLLLENGFRYQMSFADYVELVCNLPDNKIDTHLRQQTYSMYCEDKFIVDDVYQLETIDWHKFIERIHKKTGLLLSPIHENFSDPSAKTSVEDFITETLLNKLKKRYNKDLTVLGYTE